MPWYLCIEENGYNNKQHFKGAWYEYDTNPNANQFVAVAALVQVQDLDSVTAGTVAASKAVVVDSNKDIGDFRNLDAVNIDAGASGTAGTVDVFPTTASKGKLVLAAVDNDGDTTTTISNAAMGQASVISLPDPGAATANVMLTSAANDGVVVASTSIEVDAHCDDSAIAAIVVPAAPVLAAAESIQTSVVRFGDIIETTYAIDLTGLDSSTTANDIIGKAGTSYILPITTALNGVIYKGLMDCGEVPAGADTDIDLNAATAADGAYDADVTALAGYAQLVAAGGALAVGTAYPFTALPADATYLYLSVGSAGGAPGTYTAGRILLKLWGTVA